MRFSVEITEERFLFLVGVLAVVSLVGIVTGQSPNPGHGANMIGPGTFAGSSGDSWTFPGKLLVSGDVGIGTSSPSEKLDVDGSISVTGGNDVCIEGGNCLSSTGKPEKYTVVLSLRSGNCPSGYTEELVADLHGTTYVDIRINSFGVVFSGGTGENYGQEYIYSRFNKDNGPIKVCWKTFESTTRPFSSVFMFDSDNPSNCPSGYTYLSNDQIKGNNDYAYLQATDAGMYIGYRDSWATNSQPYQNGALNRQWRSTEVRGVCFRVMGVTEDANSEIFPVFLGVRDAGTCSALGSGWNSKDVSDFGNGKYSYLSWNDNIVVFGPLNSWAHYGENYGNVYFHDTHVNYVCWKLYETSGKPFTSVRLLDHGSCPSGYISIDPKQLKGYNNNGYYQQTSYGLYAGGLYTWARVAYLDGWVANSWSTQLDAGKFCFKVENAL